MPGSPPRLPHPDRLERPDQHHDIEREIVADQRQGEQLEGDRHGDADPRRHFARDPKAQRHEADVGQRIEHAVARIAEADGDRAIAVDDQRRVLEQFPERLECDRDRQHISGKPLPFRGGVGVERFPQASREWRSLTPGPSPEGEGRLSHSHE